MSAPVDGLMPWLAQGWQALLVPLATVAGSPVTALELLACVLSLAMVVCNARLNPTGWPLAMAASGLYAGLFHDSRLYGEAALQGVFIAAAAWGWWEWLRGRGADGAPLRVRRLSLRQRGLAVLAVACAWPLLGRLLDTATDSDVPYFDALPTVGSLLGQYLLGRKWLETWPTWLAVNLISVALFASKGLWLTTALYAVFAAMSVWGWRAWLAHEVSAASEPAAARPANGAA
jgi:nicotinamide mononucleotide transporter